MRCCRAWNSEMSARNVLTSFPAGVSRRELMVALPEFNSGGSLKSFMRSVNVCDGILHAPRERCWMLRPFQRDIVGRASPAQLIQCENKAFISIQKERDALRAENETFR